jgi:L-aspartate oxidase
LSVFAAEPQKRTNRTHSESEDYVMKQVIKVDTPRSVLTHLPSAETIRTGVLVIGAGAAGLAAALAAAEYRDVLVLAHGELPASNSSWAQGGIAAALATGDSPDRHHTDTLVAGADLCDPAAVALLTTEAPDLMHALAGMGVPFDRHGSGRLALGLEGGHTQRRIVHVGDATGRAITTTLIAQAEQHPRIRFLSHTQAVELIDADDRISGALLRHRSGSWWQCLADATILASGGAGALYGHTSNQPTALGEGIALAYRAGAEVADMEFVQFHPTVYRTRAGQGFLISEAVRGEGGLLYTREGERFMPAYDPRAELAPRDVVTRGIYHALRTSASDDVLLDISHMPNDEIERHFPTICARLREDGYDPTTAPIPVAPAAHYLMGGVRTDLDGRTNRAGLYAAGEVACTGVHGANRLASNSLLECLVFGQRAGIAAAHFRARPTRIAAMKPVHIEADRYHQHWRTDLAQTMLRAAGPLRTAPALADGLAELQTWPQVADPDQPDAITAANAALTARLIVASALLRNESRGGHFREDAPQPDPHWQVHTVLARAQSPYFVETMAPATATPGIAVAAD